MLLQLLVILYYRDLLALIDFSHYYKSLKKSLIKNTEFTF